MSQPQENNQALRALFTLPPISESLSAAIPTPDMPARVDVTGDREVDDVLWLHSIVETAHQPYIDKALQLRMLIATPMKVLAGRYADYVRRGTANPFAAAFASFGFGDLNGLANGVMARARTRNEAISRFGSIDAIYADTPAEMACRDALRELKPKADGYYDEDAAAKRFDECPKLVPFTIDDCLYVDAYRSQLYHLRTAFDFFEDGCSENFAHTCYCNSKLAKITARDAEDAIAAYEYLHKDQLDMGDEGATTVKHLIASGWEAHRQSSARAAELEAALRALSRMYASTWNVEGGGLFMMDSGLERFEAAHKEARRVLGIELMEVDDDGNLRPEHSVQGGTLAQIGDSDEADFDRNTWTFKMQPGFVVTAGAYLITPSCVPEQSTRTPRDLLTAAPAEGR